MHKAKTLLNDEDCRVCKIMISIVYSPLILLIGLAAINVASR